MHRCVICDYTNEEGSSYADKAPSHRNKVSWSASHGGHLCTDCSGSISNTLKDFKREDPKAF